MHPEAVQSHAVDPALLGQRAPDAGQGERPLRPAVHHLGLGDVDAHIGEGRARRLAAEGQPAAARPGRRRPSLEAERSSAGRAAGRRPCARGPTARPARPGRRAGRSRRSRCWPPRPGPRPAACAPSSARRRSPAARAARRRSRSPAAAPRARCASSRSAKAWTLTTARSTPAACSRSSMWSIRALPPTSTSALGRSLVSGRMRVPRPAASTIAVFGPLIWLRASRASAGACGRTRPSARQMRAIRGSGRDSATSWA